VPVPEIAVKVNREDLLSDFYLFCKVGLEMPVHDLPHEEMASFISDTTQKQKLMLVPRDCWKTSICSTAFPLWMVLRAWFIDQNPHYRCLIDSETTRLSKFILKAIGAYVKNGRNLIRHFGELYRKELDAGESLGHQLGQDWSPLRPDRVRRFGDRAELGCLHAAGEDVESLPPDVRHHGVGRRGRGHDDERHRDALARR
jgi:hypothetical protein